MIFIASDHAGVDLKDKVEKYLTKCELEFIDLGTNSTVSVDYPFYAKLLAENVLKNENAIGILICGTGIGMSIAVNRFSKIRGALCRTAKNAYFARRHNNANVLVLGGRDKLTQFGYKKIVKTFLSTQFEGGRHQRRIDLIDSQEKQRPKLGNIVEQVLKAFLPQYNRENGGK